ncbi:MAG: RsmD family RNA methyltransferase [Aquificota bacterium]|jgi:16S rRNA (guanine(966)-N(2))-methyltransferase RsmD
MTRKRKKRASDLKPTTGLVKNALFNILGNIEGLTFLDLFAGTGQIGLEAEKRGAEVTFVEIHRKRAEDIKQKTRKGKVIASDALRALYKLGQFDIIFADPPYNYDKYKQLIKLAQEHLSDGGLLIVEHFKKVDLEPLTPAGLEYEDKRTYGDTVLSFFRKKEEDGFF